VSLFALRVSKKARTAASSSKSGTGGSQSKSSALDNVLESIKGPKVVSTVIKSSMDWDTYKEEEKLDDGQLNAAKNG
jgi:hypothetical protein